MPTPRTLNPGSQIATIYTTDLRRLLFARKTLVLLCVQLLPVIFALIYVFLEDIDGLSMFSETVEGVMFPFLIPLAAVFYGGPTLVDEMEGKTLTYLTLRPVPKPALFLGKWLAGATVAVGLVLVPVLSLLAIVAVASGGSIGTSFLTIAQILMATVLGTAALTAIFAALGALVAKSLFAGILYFVVVELIFSVLPVVELLSVRFHMRNAAGFNADSSLGMLDQFLFDAPLDFDWWIGVLVLAVICGGAAAVGAAVFSNKQYHI
jgi:ABC-type transport system involved in multi-copper enzyme maturation permease subunit